MQVSLSSIEVERRAQAAFDIARTRSRSESLRAVLTAWQRGTGDHFVSAQRGLSMLEVTEDLEHGFENDKTFKSYLPLRNNHLFADLLVPVGLQESARPLLFFLSGRNDPGLHFEEIGAGDLTVLHLGPQYSLGDVSAAVSYCLRQQGIRIPRAWFLKNLAECGLNPADASYSSFWPVDESIGCRIVQRRKELSRAKVILPEPRVDIGPREDIGLWAEGLTMLFGVHPQRAVYGRISAAGPVKLVLVTEGRNYDTLTKPLVHTTDLFDHLQRGDMDFAMLQWSAPSALWGQLSPILLRVEKTVLVMPKDPSDIPSLLNPGWQVIQT